MGAVVGAVLALERGSDPARSPTRISPAGTPSTSAGADCASALCRTSAFDQLVCPGGEP